MFTIVEIIKINALIAQVLIFIIEAGFLYIRLITRCMETIQFERLQLPAIMLKRCCFDLRKG